jgi:hypothetical protein
MSSAAIDGEISETGEVDAWVSYGGGSWGKQKLSGRMPNLNVWSGPICKEGGTVTMQREGAPEVSSAP